MSKPISRILGVLNNVRHPHSGRFPVQNIPSLRTASGQTGGHAHYGPEYETHEGFGNLLFLATGAGIIGLALYHAYAPSNTENQESLLTRHLSNYFTSDPDQLKKIDAHNMAVVFNAADQAHFKASIERPPIRRIGNAGNFNIASPFGIVPGSETNFSDLRIKSPHDDLRKTNDVQVNKPSS